MATLIHDKHARLLSELMQPARHLDTARGTYICINDFCANFKLRHTKVADKVDAAIPLLLNSNNFMTSYRVIAKQGGWWILLGDVYALLLALDCLCQNEHLNDIATDCSIEQFEHCLDLLCLDLCHLGAGALDVNSLYSYMRITNREYSMQRKIMLRFVEAAARGGNRAVVRHYLHEHNTYESLFRIPEPGVCVAFALFSAAMARDHFDICTDILEAGRNTSDASDEFELFILDCVYECLYQDTELRYLECIGLRNHEFHVLETRDILSAILLHKSYDKYTFMLSNGCTFANCEMTRRLNNEIQEYRRAVSDIVDQVLEVPFLYTIVMKY
jgi:hypothetical protein